MSGEECKDNNADEIGGVRGEDTARFIVTEKTEMTVSKKRERRLRGLRKERKEWIRECRKRKQGVDDTMIEQYENEMEKVRSK